MGQPAKVVKFEDLAGQVQAQTAMSDEQYFRVRSHVFVDGIWAGLSPSAKAIYPVIAWKTTGFEKDSDKISHTQLMEFSGIRRRETMGAAIKELVELGLIEVSQKKGAITNYKLGEPVRVNRTTENETCTDEAVRFTRTSTDEAVRFNRTTLPKTCTDEPYTTTYIHTNIPSACEKTAWEPPCDPKEKFTITLAWEPTATALNFLKMSGVDVESKDYEQVFADFVMYWTTRTDAMRTQAEWENTLRREFSPAKQHQRTMAGSGFVRNTQSKPRETSADEQAAVMAKKREQEIAEAVAARTAAPKRSGKAPNSLAETLAKAMQANAESGRS